MSDLISRQEAIDALHMHLMYRMGTDSNKKRLDDWINGVPSAQETHEERTETHACDCISRAAAIGAICEDGTQLERQGQYSMTMAERKQRDADILDALPSAQPEIIRCKDCKHRPTRDEDGWLDFPTERCPCQNEDDFYYSWMPKDDWYCANAERREE